MCNRYSQTKDRIKLQTEMFSIIATESAKRYNIAPTQSAPVAFVNDGAAVLKDLQWGFDGHAGPVMNARTETAHEKRMFREAWQHGHCLVPADGFYEWKQMPNGKQPFRFVRRDRELFWFAGLRNEDRFTILTAPAQGCVRDLHDRTPVILRDDSLDFWLTNEPRTPEEMIFRSISPDLLECYPVTRVMSNARHITQDCIEPIQIPQQEFGFA